MPNDGQQPNQPFLYDAFISYRHVERDRKWAEWLIEALEGFRVPQPLQEHGYPPRLRKVFRDEDEVPASSDLNDQIRQALIASRYLIVVCSAFTPRSKWVEREIEMFNELGRSDQVLALLTEGEPSDSFPAAMLERRREIAEPDGSKRLVKEDKEPLAADVRPRKDVSAHTLKRLALLRLVAVILGVKFDELRQRESERERKTHVAWAALAAVLCLLIGGGTVTYWQMMLPKIANYRQIVVRWGTPEGLGAIDDETRSHLETHYSFKTQRTGLFAPPRTVEVRRENSAGALRADESGEARWAIRYGPAEFATTMEVFDANDRPKFEAQTDRGATANTVVVNYKQDTVDFAQRVRVVIDPNKQGFDLSSDITRRELTLDDRGFPIRIRYQNHYGIPQHDANGSYGRNLIVSSEGLTLRIAEVGADGNEITLRTGVRATTAVYDSSFWLIKRTSIGADDKPFDGPDGYACELSDYDSWGNLTKRTYCGVDGRPVLSKYGMAKTTASYDARGNEIQTAYFDADDKPTFGLFVYASMQRAYDDRGNKIEESYFELDGKPSLNKEGIAKIRYRYDRGREIERAFFDLNDQPVVPSFGYARFTNKYDDRGNLTETAYFGPDGKPVLTRERYASVTFTFNARNQAVRRSYFGVDGKPTLSIEGHAGFTNTYDSRGNPSRTEFFDTDGKPTIVRSLGAAGCQFSYDDRGAFTRMDCFGTDGKPTIALNGFASIQMTYDNHGNLAEMLTLGTDGKPVLTTMRYAGTRRKFDARGNQIELVNLGLDGKPTLSAEGIARINYVYDARNREIERAFFGLSDERVAITNVGGAVFGHAGYRKKYDDRGNQVEVAYFGTDGKPALTNERLARITYEFNARGQEVRRAFFGVDDKPATGIFGYAGFEQQFDARGNIVEQNYFGTDGNPLAVGLGYAKVTFVRDDLGRETDAKYFDAQGQPVAVELLIAGITPGGVGERIGLAVGDRITSYDGRKSTSATQLVNAITDASGHQTRELVIHRGTEELKYEVPPGVLGLNIRTVLAEQ